MKICSIYLNEVIILNVDSNSGELDLQGEAITAQRYWVFISEVFSPHL